MIGALFPADEAAAAEEFFQLFKTPWEPYVAGRTYDVVITTVTFVPKINARLLVVFGSGTCSLDASLHARPGCRRQTEVLELGKMRLPAYGKILTFEKTTDALACVLLDGSVVGFWKEVENGKVLRLGYNIFKEIEHLLSCGQPLDHATVPTLDLHIDALRQWMLETHLSFVEIPPAPAASSFTVCLTHDIDFIGIRCHRFDHTMWGFLFRATLGASQRFLRGKIGLGRLARCWAAVAVLPLVHLGWWKDYWLPFEWYLKVEEGLGATYYLIPFKRRVGERVPSRHPDRRAAAYDVSDLTDWIQRLQQAGCEIGVHGIDAWHSVEKGKEERDQIASVSGQPNVGIRIHWLLADTDTFRTLEEAGYDYDATVGYNETPGYRAGTGQVYRPLGAGRLLELPLLIQDGALFYPQRLDLAESKAWVLCASFIQQARAHGGIVTILWHDRSHGPERFWGDFYVRLIGELRALDPWFATASQVVDWFRARRSVIFERSADKEQVFARCQGDKPDRPFTLRSHRATPETTAQSGASRIDVTWSGENPADLSALIGIQLGQERPSSLFPEPEHRLATQQIP